MRMDSFELSLLLPSLHLFSRWPSCLDADGCGGGNGNIFFAHLVVVACPVFVFVLLLKPGSFLGEMDGLNVCEWEEGQPLGCKYALASFSLWRHGDCLSSSMLGRLVIVYHCSAFVVAIAQCPTTVYLPLSLHFCVSSTLLMDFLRLT